MTFKIILKQKKEEATNQRVKFENNYNTSKQAINYWEQNFKKNNKNNKEAASWRINIKKMQHNKLATKHTNFKNYIK